MARALNQSNDFEVLTKRALNYRNVFDPSTGFVRGRHEDGTWYSPFDPDNMKVPFITEGTSRQYTFYVPQDIPGLARLMGGEASFEKALDALFERNRYWHGNEPGHQIPFLYNYTASPWKTQREVRQILAAEYHDGPAGLKGNDDDGQMSAWYIWAALGFYPVDPVSGQYLLCSPIFDEATVQLPANKQLRILCRKQSPQSMYIASVQLNGRALSHSFITHAQLIEGGTLEFQLVDEPTGWASTPGDRPGGMEDRLGTKRLDSSPASSKDRSGD
jgi:predicted alpha-1,2-mannosidase